MTSSWDGTVGRWIYNHKEPIKKLPKCEATGEIRRSPRLALKKQREGGDKNWQE